MKEIEGGEHGVGEHVCYCCYYYYYYYYHLKLNELSKWEIERRCMED